MSQNISVQTQKNPGCLVQLAWFAFVGIWLGQAWMVAAWILMVTIVGIPLGVMMLNMLPKVMALRTPGDPRVLVSVRPDGRVTTRPAEKPQVNIILRALYFLLVGWWLSALWMEAAYAICTSIIGLPVGFWMFDRVPALLSLRRS